MAEIITHRTLHLRPSHRPRSLLAGAAAVLCALLAQTAGAQQQVSALAATDGYFEVSRIDNDTFAISEPQYWQKNIAYVLKGEKRALLFDTGSGSRDIKFIAGNVTKKPMTAVASHVHYDHIGSHASFDHVAMPDLPMLRERIHDNRYIPDSGTSLMPMLDDFYVTEWWRSGQKIDIGERVIEVLHIPGHSPDSIALIDRERGQAFVGDHLYPGDLYAFLPGADLAAWLDSTRRLLEVAEIKTVFGAHLGSAMPRQALVDLEQALAAVVEKRAQGSRVWWLGWLVARYPVAATDGNNLSILAWP